MDTLGEPAVDGSGDRPEEQESVIRMATESTPAHTGEVPVFASFVDIFAAEGDYGAQKSTERIIESTGECGDVVTGNHDMSKHSHAPRKLTFSDRVVHEARKLKQRFKKAQGDHPDHVTPDSRTLRHDESGHRGFTDFNLTPKEQWSATGMSTPRYGDAVGIAAALPPVSGGNSPLVMQPDIQVMEWFRNRFDSIDTKYRGRAESINDLSRRKVYVEKAPEVTENGENPALEAEILKLREENERLKSRVDEEADLKQRISEALMNLEEVESKLAIERKHNEENLKDKMVLQQRVTNYSQELKNLNESMDIIKNAHASEVEEHEKHKAELLAKIAQLQKDVTHFNDNLFSCYKVVESQKTEVAYLKRQNESLTDEVRRLKLDIRRLHETNSSLKSQNLSLIEINNRIRTKTLFKTDTADTCSTRGSCTSKASYSSRDEVSFFQVFNDSPSLNSCNVYNGVTPQQKDVHVEQVGGSTSCCSSAISTMNNMGKRATTEDTCNGSLYNNEENMTERLGYQLPVMHENVSNSQPNAGHVMGTGFFNHEGTAHNKELYYSKGDGSAKDTCIVDHSTVSSVNIVTPNCEVLSVRDFATDSAEEAMGALRNKSWLLEKVSRISNRDSLDFLKEKIKLITAQECKSPAFV